MALPPSLLKEVIQALPDNWRMKKSAVPGYMQKRGVKPEELEYSGLQQGLDDVDPALPQVTKQDMLAIEGARKDVQSEAKFNDEAAEYAEATLPGTKRETYEENVREFSITSEGPRRVKSHFGTDASDYMWHTRTSEDVIDGKNTRVIQELQSDLHQQGRQVGYVGQESPRAELLQKSAKLTADREEFITKQGTMPKKEWDATLAKNSAEQRKISTQLSRMRDVVQPPNAPFKTTWSRKAMEQEILDASATGKDAIAIPLQGAGVKYLQRGEGVQKWYETQIRSTMKKVAKAIGGEYKESSSNKLTKPTSKDLVVDMLMDHLPNDVRAKIKPALNLTTDEEIPDALIANWNTAIQAAPELSEIADKIGGRVNYGQIILPKDKAGLSNLKLYAAGGAEALLISQSLSDGAPPHELKQFLVQEQGMSEEDANEGVDRAAKLKISSAFAQGAKPEEVTEFLLSKGYDEGYLQTLMAAEDEAPEAQQAAEAPPEDESFLDGLIRELKPAYKAMVDLRRQEFPEEHTAEELSAKVANIHSKYATMPTAIQVGLGFGTEEDRAQAIADTLELNNLISSNLNANDITSQVDPKTGDIWVQNEAGTWDELDIGLWDSLVASRGEILGGVGAGVAGAAAVKGLEIPGPPIVKAGAAATAAIIAGATGATFGRGVDITRNALETKEKIDSRLMWEQLKDAGAADIVFSVAGTALAKFGIAGAKSVYRAYDLVVKGNKEGAYKALKEFMHLDDGQIDEIIGGWEKATGKKAPGLMRSTKALSIIPRVQQGGEAIVGPATTLDPIASSTISKEIADRAADLIKTAETASSDRISTILRDELISYKDLVKQRYGGLKEFAIQEMAETGYKFDYSKLAIDPLLERTVKSLTNSAPREQALLFMQRIRELGGTAEEIITAGTKQVQETRAFRRGGPEAITKTVPTEVTKEVIVPTLRSFEDLLELRRVLNEFAGKKFIKNAKDIELMVNIRKRIDGEIARATKEHMPQADTWLGAWKEANTEYGKMFDMEANVLYRNIMRSGTTDKAVARQLMNRAMATDNTFRQVIEKLPPKIRALTENAVMQEFVEKFAIGEEGGMRAIQFPLLSKELSQIAFTTTKAQELKRTITAMADVFKNDVNLARVVGNMTVPKFQSYLTTDPVVRAKYEIASTVFNYIRRLAPTKRGNAVALVMKMGEVLEKPRNGKAFKELMKALPADPALKNSLKAAQLQIAGYGQKSDFPKVTIHRQAAPGKSLASSKGELGEGVYYTVGKQTPAEGQKTSSKSVLPTRIANEDNIKEALGIDELTTKILRDNPQVQEVLKDKGFLGLSLKDKILIFK